MAEQRKQPYIWVKWLSRVMSGAVSCQWQYWFQAHHRLSEKRPSDFDMITWQVKHTRLLTDLRRELASPEVTLRTEPRLQCRVPGVDAIVEGRPDCLAINGANVTVYDCKTGTPRDSDQVQVMIYMYALSTYPQHARSRIQGAVVYPDQRVEIPYLTDDFVSALEYFVALLADTTPLPRAPGDDCRYCNITARDCPARQD